MKKFIPKGLGIILALIMFTLTFFTGDHEDKNSLFIIQTIIRYALLGVAWTLVVMECLKNMSTPDVLGIWFAVITMSIVEVIFMYIVSFTNIPAKIEEITHYVLPDTDTFPVLEQKYKLKNNEQVVDKLGVLFFILAMLTVCYVNITNPSRKDYIKAGASTLYTLVGLGFMFMFVYCNISSQLIPPVLGEFVSGTEEYIPTVVRELPELEHDFPFRLFN